jgi:hypothetical protein
MPVLLLVLILDLLINWAMTMIDERKRVEMNNNNMEEMIIPGVVNASAAVCALSHVE